MAERGFTLIEMLVVIAIAAVTGTVAMRVLAELPPRAREWEEASGERQALRAVEARLARLAARASPIEVVIEEVAVRVPAVWPRRLGFTRADPAATVSTTAVTFLTRADGHRVIEMSSGLAAGGGSVAFAATGGCGSDATCGVRAGDVLLAVHRDGACGLFRVIAIGARLELEPLMDAGAPSFPPGSAIVPIEIDVIEFDADEGALRKYDGYRSENVVVDGMASAAVGLSAPAPLADGPFVGTGALAFDADQLSIAGVAIELQLAPRASRLPPARARLAWRTGQWP